MTPANLLILADRVEGLSGPDREVDDAIATAIFEESQRVCIKGLSDEAGGMWMFRYPNGSIGSSLRFTGSLDAAMTLVPSLPDGGTFSVIRRVSGEPCTADIDFEWHGDAATPALALTAASLRAIAANQENDCGR